MKKVDPYEELAQLTLELSEIVFKADPSITREQLTEKYRDRLLNIISAVTAGQVLQISKYLYYFIPLLQDFQRLIQQEENRIRNRNLNKDIE